MPIRNPKYIVEAKEKAAKKSNIQAKNIREKAMKNEDVIKEKKCKYNISSEKTLNIAAALNMEQNDDCIIISYANEKQNINN